MKKDLQWLNDNIKKDIERANVKEIDLLLKELNELLKKYDNDSFFKNVKDWLKKVFVNKREKCKYIFNDLIEEINKPDFCKKDELRTDLLRISNIHRDFLENLISLLENL